MTARIIKAAVLLAVLVATGAAFLAWTRSWPVVEPVPFDSGIWLAAAELAEEDEPGCVRGGMALDIIERKLLAGKTATEVVRLLGNPTDTHGGWSYALGQCSGGWSLNDMRLTFDDGARVAKASFR